MNNMNNWNKTDTELPFNPPPKGGTFSVWLGKVLQAKLHHYAIEHEVTKGEVVRTALSRLLDEADR